MEHREKYWINIYEGCRPNCVSTTNFPHPLGQNPQSNHFPISHAHKITLIQLELRNSQIPDLSGHNPCLSAVTCEFDASVSYWCGHTQWIDVGKWKQRERDSGTKVLAPCCNRSICDGLRAFVCVHVCWGVFECVHPPLQPIPSACLSHLSTAGEQTSGERERNERGGQRKLDRERNGQRVTAGTKVI